MQISTPPTAAATEAGKNTLPEKEEYVFDGETFSSTSSPDTTTSKQLGHFIDFIQALRSTQLSRTTLAGWRMTVNRDSSRRVSREFTSPCAQFKFTSKQQLFKLHPPTTTRSNNTDSQVDARPKRLRKAPSISACTIAPSLAAKRAPTPISALVSRANRILVLLGAGVSTSAGLPDFRSKLIGLYAQASDEEIPPEVLFDNELFDQDPLPFYRFAGKTFLPQIACARPTATHAFVASLGDKLLRCYTQNVDGLELKAGVPRDKLVEVHGTLTSATCIECAWKTDKPGWWKSPDCQQCDNYLKPDMKFFGQEINFRSAEMERDCEECDLFLVMGTSLSVQPVSYITQLVSTRQVKQRVWVNRAAPPKSKAKFFNNIQLGECDEIVKL